MARPRDADLVPVDVAALRAAMDGRRQDWLAEKVGLTCQRVSAIFKGGARVRTHRDTYERMRAALPSLPPPPEPASNGHAVAEDGGAMPGPS